jgi:hypothetical protein
VDALRLGIRLDEGLALLAQPLRMASGAETKRLEALLDVLPARLTWYRGVLTQGWKRQLRRMFGAVGAPIERLVRVRIGPVRLDDLPSGRTRRLRHEEIRRLGSPSQPSRGGGGGSGGGRSETGGRSSPRPGSRPGARSGPPAATRRSAASARPRRTGP